jgi:hypothetical protein
MTLHKLVRLFPIIIGLGFAGALPAQTLILTPSTTALAPGSVFTLQIHGDTGGHDILGFSLYLNMEGTDSTGLFTVTGFSLAAPWSYYGSSPASNSIIPNAGNSQDYGNALANDAQPASTYALTTLTVALSSSASVGYTYSLQTSASSVMVDSLGNEYNFPSTSINLTVVPEPVTYVALLGTVILAFAIFMRRRGYRISQPDRPVV